MCVDGGDGCFWSVIVWYERCGCKRDACKNDLNHTQTSVCLHLRCFCHISTSLRRQTHSFLCLRGYARSSFCLFGQDQVSELPLWEWDKRTPVSWQTGLSTGTHINDVFRLNNANLKIILQGKKHCISFLTLWRVWCWRQCATSSANPFQRSKVTACICWVEKQGNEKKTFDKQQLSLLNSSFTHLSFPHPPSLMLSHTFSISPYRKISSPHPPLRCFSFISLSLSLPLLTGIKEWH